MSPERDPDEIIESAAGKLQREGLDWSRRFTDAGLTNLEKVCVLLRDFDYQVHQNGLAGWISNGYPQPGVNDVQRVIAAAVARHATLDPEVARLVGSVMKAVDEGPPYRDGEDHEAWVAHMGRIGFFDALLWERGERVFAFYGKVLAAWDGTVDPFSLAPAWPEPPGAAPKPSAKKPRYPAVAVGLTEAGGKLPVRMDDFETASYLTITGAVARGLWLAGVPGEEIREFLTEANADRVRLPETCARWIRFDGTGGTEGTLDLLRTRLHPPHPLARELGFRARGIDGVDLVLGDVEDAEAIAALLKDWNAKRIEPEAPFRDQMRAALRWDPDVVHVVDASRLTEEDVTMIGTAMQTGHLVVVGGLPEARKGPLRAMARLGGSRVVDMGEPPPR
jgi:hypothetical protein